MEHYWIEYGRRCLECSHQLLEMQSVPHWTTQFQSFGVGLGAMLAGVGGLKIGLDWLDQVRLKRKVAKLLRKYPVGELGSSYRLVDLAESAGKWWLLDEKEIPKTRHWVQNYDTVRDMRWHGETDKGKPVPVRITRKELEQYGIGKPINTREF